MRLSFSLISGFKIDNPLRAVIRVLAECRIILAIKHVGYRGKAESWESKHGKGLSRVLANQTNGAPWLLFRLWEFCRSCKRNISVRPKTLERDKGRTRAFPLSFLPSGFYLSVVKQPRTRRCYTGMKSRGSTCRRVKFSRKTASKRRILSLVVRI